MSVMSSATYHGSIGGSARICTFFGLPRRILSPIMVILRAQPQGMCEPAAGRIGVDKESA